MFLQRLRKQKDASDALAQQAPSGPASWPFPVDINCMCFAAHVQYSYYGHGCYHLRELNMLNIYIYMHLTKLWLDEVYISYKSNLNDRISITYILSSGVVVIVVACSATHYVKKCHNKSS